MTRHRLRHTLLAVLADLAAVSLAYALYYALRFHFQLLPTPRFMPVELVGPALATAGFWVVVFAAFGLYRERMLRQWGFAQTIRLAKALAVGILVLFFVLFIDTLRPGAARLTIPVYGLSLFAVVWAVRWGVYRLLRGSTVAGVGLTRLAIVGERDRVEYVAGLLDAHPDLGYRPVVLVAFDPQPRSAPQVVYTSRLLAAQSGFVSHAEPLQSPAQLADTVQQVVAQHAAEEMLVLLAPRDIAYYLELVRVCSRLSVPMRFVSNYRPILAEAAEDEPLEQILLPAHLSE